MNYKKYTDGIIFIDDQKEEVIDAINFFNDRGINTLFFNPLDVASNSSCLGYNFVFLDLSYDGEVDITTAVNSLLSIVEKGEKHFVVVAWTMHQDDINTLEKEIKIKMAGCYPLMVLCGEKFKILNRKRTTGFNEIFNNTLNKLEVENPLLFKMLEWKKNMTSAVNENFYKLVEKSYDGNTIDLNKYLGILANKTLSKNSMLSALDTLNNRVNNFAINKLIGMEDITLQYDESLITTEERMSYNFECLFSKITTSFDIPGSIYKVGNKLKYQTLKKAYTKKERNNKSLTLSEIYCKKLDDNKIFFETITPIKVNITPNCTFASQNNKNTTYLDGIIVEGIDESQLKKVDNIGDFKKNGGIFYKFMEVNKKICILKIFPDKCSYNLENGKKIYQLNSNVKVEIQHSFGSWVSRVGNILY